MTYRKLLPYEHQLCEALNVTKEEYLDFLAAQRDYSLSAEERAAITRADVGTVALILTVIGIIFQVVASFFAPDDPKNKQKRAERFSPRFGFNSSQDLAKYGDPLNLIYTSTIDNSLGGVRAGTQLVWSAVENYGSSQFAQLLLVLGAAKILTLDPKRFAFGQLSLKEVLNSKVWIYYNGSGRVKFGDKVLGDGRDPTRLEGTPVTDDVCKIADGTNRKEGYSQAFSPTSQNVFGIYSAIPINVEIQERKGSGSTDTALLGVEIVEGSWNTTNNKWAVGDRITLRFREIDKKKDEVAQEAAKDIRYPLVESLDPATTYKLGTAKFRLRALYGENNENDLNIDNRNVFAQFECIEEGRRPFTSYIREKPYEFSKDERKELELYLRYLKSPYEEKTENGTPLDEGVVTNTLLPGSTYLDYIDRQEARLNTLQNAPFRFSFLGTSYDFATDRVVTWETDIQDRDNQDFKTGTFTIPPGGSIAFTKRRLKEFLADKPTISVKKLRASYETDLEDLRDLRDQLTSGQLDPQLEIEVRRDPAVVAARQQVKTLVNELRQYQDDQYKQGLIKNPDPANGYLRATGTRFDPGDNTEIKSRERAIDDARDAKEEAVRAAIGARRRALVNQIRSSTSQFTLFGKTFAGGIRYVKSQLRNLDGERTTDRRGTIAIKNAYRALIQEKEQAANFLEYATKNWEMLSQYGDRHFYTKCLVKYEEANYTTVSTCDYVKFAIKCRVFRSISGRAKKYGEKDAPDGFKGSDNGIKGRLAMFRFKYKRTTESVWQSPPVIFTVRRGADQDNFVGLHFEPKAKAKWDFRFEPISDMGAELLENGQTSFCFIQNSGNRERFFHLDNEIRFVGKLIPVNTTYQIPNLPDRGPVMTNEWDLFSTRSDSELQGSFSNGPEFTITVVTEQQRGSIEGKYSKMSMLAFGLYSGLGFQDLRNITAYVTEGKQCFRLNIEDGTYSKFERSSSWAPDIFLDTVLDNDDGIGKYAKVAAIDIPSLVHAKRFCRDNGLGTRLCMDGVIADQTSWRQFWVEAAPYSLLEFARIGGRETLIPAIPTTTTGAATRVVPVTSLFNQGNILEGSYKEEFLDYGSDVQDLIATIIYRETEFEDVFPRNASVTVSRIDAEEQVAIRQTFDLSQFVTQRAQAILFGKWIVNQRRWVKRGIEFRTFPTDTPVAPGAYILVDVGLNTWDQLTTGVILSGGQLNVPLNTPIPPGTYSVMLYKPGGTPFTLSGITVDASGIAPALAPYTGRLFVLGAENASTRVFRVSEVTMDEEGEVTVRATEYPCERVGNEFRSHIADFRGALFSVR